MKIKCAGCPAVSLLDVEAIVRTEALRAAALHRMNGRPRLLILAESRPANRFVYDPDTDYDSRPGLRTYLRRELTGTDDDAALFSFLDRRRVWIADCALCPLYLLKTNKQKRHAATACLLSYTRAHLDQYPEVPIATVFPAHRGFLKLEAPDIQERVVSAFDFRDLSGLRQLVDAVC